MEEKRYTVKELLEIAKIDQGDDDQRDWTFTSSCNMCGGVAAFLYYLEEIGNNSKEGN